MITKIFFFSIVLIPSVTITSDKPFPVVGSITYSPNGDDYFGPLVSHTVLRHSTGNTPGSTSPLPKPQEFNIQRPPTKTSSVARQLNFNDLDSDECRTNVQKSIEHKIKQVVKIVFEEHKEEKINKHKTVFIEEKDDANDTKNFIPNRSWQNKQLVPTITESSIPFYENKEELEEAIKALTKFLKIRTEIAQKVPELTIDNNAWRAELRNLYSKKCKFNIPYNTTLVGCHSFADITTHIRAADFNTRRCYKAYLSYT